MKKKLLFWVIVFFFVNISPAISSMYTIQANCSDNVCIEGQNVEWNVMISNKGTDPIEYIAVELLDTINNSLIAAFKARFNPLSEDRGNTIVVNSGEQTLIKINSTMPSANKNNELIFYPCFNTATPSTDDYYRGRGVYNIRQCYNPNESATVFKCISDKHCGIDEACRNYKCVKFKCKECQYISNHACYNHECCSSESCKIAEECINNTCINLDCKYDYVLENHSCKLLNCSEEESIIDKMCIRLNCADEEFPSNHTCNRLNCSDIEYISEHKCKLLACEEKEYAAKHECNLLKCQWNETYDKHKCAPLDCYFFQKIENNKCSTDMPFIVKLLIELAALGLIAVFIILDIKKYKSKKNNPSE